MPPFARAALRTSRPIRPNLHNIQIYQLCSHSFPTRTSTLHKTILACNEGTLIHYFLLIPTLLYWRYFGNVPVYAYFDHPRLLVQVLLGVHVRCRQKEMNHYTCKKDALQHAAVFIFKIRLRSKGIAVYGSECSTARGQALRRQMQQHSSPCLFLSWLMNGVQGLQMRCLRSCQQGSVKGPRVKHEDSISLIKRNGEKYCNPL